MNGKAIRMGWLAVALLPLLLAGFAGAQVRPYTEEQMGYDQQVAPTEQTREFHPKLEKADRLLGAKVVDNEGKRAGTIKDIVLTPDHSGIDYVVLSYGGTWGTPSKLLALPWAHFQVQPNERTLVLKENGKALQSAKGFDKDNWPYSLSERRMEGAAPTARGIPMADFRYRKVSELLGINVGDAQGERIGKVQDVMIDVQQGKLAYAIVSMRSGFLGVDKDLAAVPWSVLEILPESRMARLNADRQTLEAIAFDARNFPNLEDPQYSRQLYERFNVTPYWETLGYVAPAGGMEPRGMSLWMEGSQYNLLFNPSAVETIHGTVQRVDTFRLEGTPIQGLSLHILTEEGKTMVVHTGPSPYVERHDFHFNAGDKVTIIGAPATWNGRNIFLASQVKLGDKTLNLRSDEGKPRWSANDLKNFEAQNVPALRGSERHNEACE